jgi:hypothetical protein
MTKSSWGEFMKKIALFPFRDDMMCFIHVLLNAQDMKDKGHEVTVVMEGAAVTLLPKLAQPDNPMHELFNAVRNKGLIEGACRACSSKLKVAADIESLGIPLIGDMSNHPGMASYIERGYEIITF